jgi:YidC/Oxa1 family membrane protein insertase
MDFQRLLLMFVFGFSVILLWEAWQKEGRPPVPAEQAAQIADRPSASQRLSDAPQGAVPQGKSAGNGEKVSIRTDLLRVEFDTLGASIRRVELVKHQDAGDTGKAMVLLDPAFEYEAQSGLLGEGQPTHRTLWRVVPGVRELGADANALEVRFAAERADGQQVSKVYTFNRDSYVVDVRFEGPGIDRNAHAYFQLVRNEKDPPGQITMMSTFFGPALFTEKTAYRKIAFSDIDKGKAEVPAEGSDGWIGMVQHYFLSAWLPSQGTKREFYVRKGQDGRYAAGVVLPVAASTADGPSIQSQLFIGPQEQDRLRTLAPGLDLVVDYGWLTIIAWPLFWLLKLLHSWAGNWGVAIIMLTILLKLIFLPLSAASYRSMAKMKLVAPRLQKLREMYGNDRAKMTQATMDLYKTEKINPLGGCFPILVQIPVFIALYWVLLAAIELRHAPFVLWIEDLSTLDPYFVLPTLMTATMVIQTRMNPKPPDPVQAKVMAVMPFAFSIFFFFFPAGLVLYWLVNNILSILQQWQIQRIFERDRPAHGKR